MPCRWPPKSQVQQGEPSAVGSPDSEGKGPPRGPGTRFSLRSGAVRPGTGLEGKGGESGGRRENPRFATEERRGGGGRRSRARKSRGFRGREGTSEGGIVRRREAKGAIRSSRVWSVEPAKRKRGKRSYTLCWELYALLSAGSTLQQIVKDGGRRPGVRTPLPPSLPRDANKGGGRRARRRSGGVGEGGGRARHPWSCTSRRISPRRPATAFVAAGRRRHAGGRRSRGGGGSRATGIGRCRGKRVPVGEQPW